MQAMFVSNSKNILLKNKAQKKIDVESDCRVKAVDTSNLCSQINR